MWNFQENGIGSKGDTCFHFMCGKISAFTLPETNDLLRMSLIELGGLVP